MNLSDYLATWKLSSSLTEQLERLFTIKNVLTGDTILNMGENTGRVYLILQGIARGFYLSADGRDVTKCFSKEGDWCGVYNYLTEDPSLFYIEALEDCVLAEIRVDHLKDMIEKHAEVRKIYDALNHQAFLLTEEKGTSFQMMTGKERYLFFTQKHPDVVKRVKQEYIASYLGVTPSSLSRIKREL